MRRSRRVRHPAADREPSPLGAKARHLRWLADHGYPVPEALAIPFDAAAAVGADPTGAAARTLRDTIATRLDPTLCWAVRSSAEVEDGIDASYAGRFLTVLDVRDADALVAAVAAVARSGERVAASPPRIGVVIQRLVPAVASGVAFSRNPLTGLDEVVIEAVAGRGDALVQDGVTPDRWVYRWGELTEQPASPQTDAAVALTVARETRRIAAAYGRPVDLEWAHDGTGLWWLQVRPVTALADVPIYSNRIAREVLPGLVPPLVWSLNVPIVNSAWVDLFTEAIGPNEIEPERLARAFGFRAYFDMRAIGDIFVALGMPRDSLELLLGLPAGTERPRFRPTTATYRHLPRLMGLGWRMVRSDRRYARELPALRERLDALAAASPRSGVGAARRPPTDERVLLERIDRTIVLARELAYANIVVPLVMNLFGAIVRRLTARAGLDPVAVDPARDVATSGRTESGRTDPRPTLDELRGAVASLDGATRARLAATAADDGDGRDVVALLATDAGLQGICADLEAFLERFGHLGDRSADVTAQRWAEDPRTVVRMILEPPGRPPTPGMGWREVRPRIGRASRPLAGWVFRRAGTFRHLREELSSEYTRAFALLRWDLLALGDQLVGRGLLADRDDVAFLALEELRSLSAPDAGPLQELVAERRAAIAAAEDLDLPDLILGDDFVPRRRSGGPIRDLRGVPAARGTFRGPARIVRSVSDGARVRPGDVLVVPYSDVAWTPLFARAGAVVAEAGGMLSHSAIVARENGIPCVVSVPAATSLPDDAIVHVDGYHGIVTVEDVA